MSDDFAKAADIAAGTSTRTTYAVGQPVEPACTIDDLMAMAKQLDQMKESAKLARAVVGRWMTKDEVALERFLSMVDDGAEVFVGKAVWAKLQEWAARPGGDKIAAVLGTKWRLCEYLPADGVMAVRDLDWSVTGP